MINNCLDIGIMEPMYYNENLAPSYVINEDNTFRGELTKANPEGFVKMRGVVTADVSALGIGNKYYIKDIPVAEGITVLTEGTNLVASVSAPKR